MAAAIGITSLITILAMFILFIAVLFIEHRISTTNKLLKKILRAIEDSDE
jgi:hypothetical protein